MTDDVTTISDKFAHAEIYLWDIIFYVFHLFYIGTNDYRVMDE